MTLVPITLDMHAVPKDQHLLGTTLCPGAPSGRVIQGAEAEVTHWRREPRNLQRIS